MKLKIAINGKTYDVEVEVVEQDLRPSTVGAGSTRLEGPARPAAASGGGGPQVADGKGVKSPLQGMVSSIECKPGQEVKAEDPLVVLEAMKMLTTISSPDAGVIKAVFVNVGDAVKQGQVVVEFE